MFGEAPSRIDDYHGQRQGASTDDDHDVAGAAAGPPPLVVAHIFSIDLLVNVFGRLFELGEYSNPKETLLSSISSFTLLDYWCLGLQ